MNIFKNSKLPGYLHLSDIQGLAQLAAQATLGVADLAEKVQGNVYKTVAAPFGPAGQKFVDRGAGKSGVNKYGITGLVYGSVKGVTRLAAGGVDAVLSRVAPKSGPQNSSPQREAVLAALNGVLGDRLQETINPLAIEMSLRHNGESLVVDKAALARRLPGATSKLLVLVHGLCMNDLQWRPKNPSGDLRDFGESLAKELGYTPVYLHYNSGLHTSTNGGQFAALLEQLVKAWPQPVQELSLLVHSMGGLVARSACHSGAAQGHSWLGKLKHLVFLGTPHHGAPLERVGNWVDVVLGSNVVTRPFARIGQIRSAGITDLRHGHVLQDDWQGADRFAPAADSRTPVPLPNGMACYAVAAAVGAAGSGYKSQAGDQLLGDGLVPLSSALGQHADAARELGFPPEKQWVARETGHMALLHSPAVYAQVKSWLS
ncbi:MAG TPA: alpha/beta hydrolase [Polaromonas sp.]|uniref:esterase/lipase family protein n=1 Tax=Polaromonas sp. TaxID=1869339 RepID=UPI002D6F0BCA|nr:alpha/beta hydrolase [Polaromonas sp.]HYW58181.1 alpha/beta hydrolase [Polaromonas sp.]